MANHQVVTELEEFSPGKFIVADCSCHLCKARAAHQPCPAREPPPPPRSSVTENVATLGLVAFFVVMLFLMITELAQV